MSLFWYWGEQKTMQEKADCVGALHNISNVSDLVQIYESSIRTHLPVNAIRSFLYCIYVIITLTELSRDMYNNVSYIYFSCWFTEYRHMLLFWHVVNLMKATILTGSFLDHWFIKLCGTLFLPQDSVWQKLQFCLRRSIWSIAWNTDFRNQA